MRKAVLPVILVLAIMFALTARGRVVVGLKLDSGRDLLATCTAEDQLDRSLCTGYVLGTLDAKKPLALGIPRSFSLLQVIDTTVQYLQAHPEKLDERSTDLIMLAVRKLETN